MMKIGFGQADITPRGGKLSLIGQMYKRYTDEIHDPLHAVAMIIESDSARTVWVGIDSIQLYATTTEYALAEVRKVIPDLKDEEFVISATHIHTGPDLCREGMTLGMKSDRSVPDGVLTPAECARQTVIGIAAAVREALKNMKEARIDVSVARIQTGVTRRIAFKDGSAAMYGNAYREDFLKAEGRDGGPTQLIYVYDMQNKLFGVVANVPCTAQCDEGALYATADYWGVVRERIQAEFGQDVKVLGLCRAAGDLSPHHIIDRTPMERDEGLYTGRKNTLYLGNLIADAIISHKKYVIASYEGNVRHHQATRMVDFPTWEITEAEYKEALAYFADKNNFNEDGTPKVAFDNSNARGRKIRFENNNKVHPAPIACTVLGNLVFITSPFELYIEYADRIRMALGDNMVFDVQLTYENLAYLPTPQAVAGGGYSANLACNTCSHTAGPVLVEESVSLAKELLKK